MSESILVTGGAGFIGSHLIERLAARGCSVVAFDNFDSYYERELKENNVAEALKDPNITLIEGDIREPAQIESAVEVHSPKTVIHLAGRPGVRRSFELAELYQETNVTGTLNVLRACVRSGVTKLVFASSSSVYGEVGEMAKEDDVCRPLSPYGASKVAAEALCHAFAAQSGLDVVMLRFFTVFGPRQRPDMAFHRFANLMAAGEELPIYGDGTVLRDFTYISDIVSGIEASAMSPAKGVHIYNLGGSRPIELIKAVRLLEQHMGVKARLRFESRQPGDATMTFADVSRAGADLGFKPSVGIEEGIGKFVQWHSERRHALETIH